MEHSLLLGAAALLVGAARADPAGPRPLRDRRRLSLHDDPAKRRPGRADHVQFAAPGIPTMHP